MNELKKQQIEYEVKKEAKIDLIKQFIGVLSALIPVLTLLGIHLEWFTYEFIDALDIFLVALVPFVINVYTIYKNHFSGKKAQEEKRVLKEKGLR